MSSERHRRVSELFVRVCDLDAGARAAFLDKECAGDKGLRADVDALLARDDGSSWGGRSNPLGQSLTLSPEESPLPEFLAQYRVIRRLGEGGMGEVFLVEQLEPLCRLMALKLVRKGLDTRDVIARFESERQALALMTHPNIARVYEAGATEGGRPYFAMEYVEGAPITSYCDAERLSIRRRIELFIEVCNGVQHAHQKGVIHRDIKPSNLLVQVQDGSSVPKIIDFGIAKATEQRLSEKSFFTHTGVLVGTPEYMSPEQAQGRPNVDTRTDVYSLGLVLYELLVGALPIEARDLRRAGYLELCRLIQEKPTPRPSERLATLGEGAAASASRRGKEVSALRRRVQGDLDWIVLKALEKDPERRYHSASELAADLRCHLDHRPVSAGPPSVQYQLRKFARRHRVGVTVAVLLLAFGFAFVVTVSVQLRIQEQERAKAELEARKSERVVEFLREMLAAPDLDKLGLDARIVDVLDAAAEDANDGFADEPEVEAMIRETIGISYRGIGAFEKADRELTKALEIRRGTLAENDLSLVKIHRELGQLRFDQERVSQSLDEVTRALEIHRANPEGARLQAAQMIGDLGLIHTALGNLEQAEALLREAISILEAEEEQDERVQISLASTYESLAGVMFRTDRVEQAEEFVQATLDTKRKLASGGIGPGVATSLHNLAFLKARRGAHVEAVPLFLECIEMEISLVGTRNHLRLTRPLAALGVSYVKLGKAAEGEELIRESLAISREFLAPGAKGIASVLTKLSHALSVQGKQEEADAASREAQKILGTDGE